MDEVLTCVPRIPGLKIETNEMTSPDSSRFWSKADYESMFPCSSINGSNANTVTVGRDQDSCRFSDRFT